MVKTMVIVLIAAVLGGTGHVLLAVDKRNIMGYSFDNGTLRLTHLCRTCDERSPQRVGFPFSPVP